MMQGRHGHFECVIAMGFTARWGRFGCDSFSAACPMFAYKSLMVAYHLHYPLVASFAAHL
jgi:hypothetical protein